MVKVWSKLYMEFFFIMENIFMKLHVSWLCWSPNIRKKGSVHSIKSTDKGRQIVIDNWFLPINCLCEYHLTYKIYHRVDNQRLTNNHKQRYVWLLWEKDTHSSWDLKTEEICLQLILNLECARKYMLEEEKVLIRTT